MFTVVGMVHFTAFRLLEPSYACGRLQCMNRVFYTRRRLMLVVHIDLGLETRLSCLTMHRGESALLEGRLQLSGQALC